jgi:hypothetical protein
VTQSKRKRKQVENAVLQHKFKHPEFVSNLSLWRFYSRGFTQDELEYSSQPITGSTLFSTSGESATVQSLKGVSKLSA